MSEDQSPVSRGRKRAVSRTTVLVAVSFVVVVILLFYGFVLLLEWWDSIYGA
jgi:preprotein translocase subunit SecG